MPAAGLASTPPGRAPAATPPGPAVDPAPSYPCGPSNAAGAEIHWQFGRATEELRAQWAAGVRVAAAECCPDCTAPLTWQHGELVCRGCAHSGLPLKWRRAVTILWLSGATASEIAGKLRSTKSAVMGYRTRARLPGRGSPLQGVPDSVRAKRAARRASLKPTVQTENRAFFVWPKRVAKVPASPSGKPAPPGGVGVAENMIHPKGGSPRHAPRHGFTTCQFIFGRAKFCDDATAALSPYCEAHTRLCYAGKAA